MGQNVDMSLPEYTIGRFCLFSDRLLLNRNQSVCLLVCTLLMMLSGCFAPDVDNQDLNVEGAEIGNDRSQIKYSNQCPEENFTDSENECALTLEEAIQFALQHNVDLYLLRQSQKVQKLRLAIDENQFRPELTLRSDADLDAETGSVTLDTNIKVPTGGNVALGFTQRLNQPNASLSQSLTFTQPLLKDTDVNITDKTLRQERLEDQERIQSYRQSIASKVNEIIGAYRSLSEAIRQVEISEESLERTYEQLEATKALISVGQVAAREAERLKSAVANGELSLVRARNGLDRSQYALIDLLELDSGIRIRPLEVFEVESVQPVLEPDLAQVLSRRSDYISAQIAIENAKVEVKKAENEYLPDIRFTLGATKGQKPDFGLSASLPLSNRRQREISFRQASNALFKAERDIIEMREKIRIEIRQAVHDIDVNLRIIELARDSRDLAKENLSVEQGKYEQGLSSAADLTTVERELASAEEAVVVAIVDYLNALTSLDTVTGLTLERWGITVEAVEP